MTTKRVFIVLASSAITLAQAASAVACAVCLSGADGGITEGYNASVLFLMATPYLVAASVALGLMIAYRRALKRQREEENSVTHLELNQEENSR